MMMVWRAAAAKKNNMFDVGVNNSNISSIYAHSTSLTFTLLSYMDLLPYNGNEWIALLWPLFQIFIPARSLSRPVVPLVYSSQAGQRMLIYSEYVLCLFNQVNGQECTHTHTLKRTQVYALQNMHTGLQFTGKSVCFYFATKLIQDQWLKLEVIATECINCSLRFHVFFCCAFVHSSISLSMLCVLFHSFIVFLMLFLNSLIYTYFYNAA